MVEVIERKVEGQRERRNGYDKLIERRVCLSLNALRMNTQFNDARYEYEYLSHHFFFFSLIISQRHCG